MNSAEPRWRVVVPIVDEEAWELALAELSDWPVEGIVELADRAEVYFERQEQAMDAAVRFGLRPPVMSEPGGGEVFGQLPHPSTQLCMDLMREWWVNGARVADIGSGTGLLSRQAVELGATLVVAADVDQPAVLASRGVVGAVAFQGSADALAAGAFRIVLANLHLSLWRQLAPEIARVSAPGARLFASGLLDQQRSDAEGLLAAHGWRIHGARSAEGWLALAAWRSV